MAVHSQARRRGFGKWLVRAAEDVVREVGEEDVYLHLRVQDKPAAALYAAMGFTAKAKDWLLVRLLGQDQRFLMHKRVERPGAAAAEGGVGAAAAAVATGA